MMIRLLLVLVGLVTVAGAAEVTVHDSPGWAPASEAQRKALPKDPSYRMLDFSIRAPGGAGTVQVSPINGTISKQWVDGAVTGFLSSTKESGLVEVERKPAVVGHLKGICITLRGAEKGPKVGIVTHLVFSDRNMYAIGIYGPVGLKASDPLVADYLARVDIPASVQPGNIERDSAYELGRRVGQMAVWVLMGIGLMAAIVAIIRRYRASRPPPLPG